jgi:hypothetical protein
VLRGIFGPVRHKVARTRDRVRRLVTRAAPRPPLAVAEGPPERGAPAGDADRDVETPEDTPEKDSQTAEREDPAPATPEEPHPHA